MTIDPEVKRTLDLRLAKGELDARQYQDLLKTLGDRVEAIPVAKIQSGDLLAEIDDLQIFSTHVQVASRRKTFDEVRRVGGGSNTFSINLVPATKNTWISIAFTNGDSYYMDEDRTLFGRDRHKKIAQCVSVLRQITFKSRLAALATATNETGAIQIGTESNETYILVGALVDVMSKPRLSPIFLSKAGQITNGVLSLDLKRCRAEGVLELGIERINKHAPGQIYACYHRSLLEKSRNKALKFYLGGEYDTDVVLALLDWFAHPNNHLGQ